MRSWVLAASLLAAAAMVPAGASAADVGDDDDRGAYSDPRRKYFPPPGPGYKDRYDDDYDDDDQPASKRFSGPPPFAPPGSKYSNQNCARSGDVRQRLIDSGWQDFRDGHQRGDMVVMKARRPNGRLFELTLHRCSGQIVEVRPLEARPFGGGPYAFNRPYRYDDGPYGYGDNRRWRDAPPYAYGGPRRWWWYGD
jgi:hypothetical protein